MLAVFLITCINAFLNFELAAYTEQAAYKHAFTAGAKLSSASTLMKHYFREQDWPFEKALRAMGGDVPEEVMSLLRQKGKSSKNVRSKAFLLQDREEFGASGVEWTDDELDRARVILNKMYDTEQGELDILLFDCKQVIDGLTAQIDENIRVKVLLGEQTAMARGDQLKASQDIGEAKDQNLDLTGQLKAHQELCLKTLTAKKAELDMAEADYNVALKIQTMSACTDEQVAEAIALDKKGGAAFITLDADANETALPALVTQAQTITVCTPHRGNSNEDEFFLFGGMHGHKFHTKAARFAMQRMAKLAMQRNLGKHSYRQNGWRAAGDYRLLQEDPPPKGAEMGEDGEIEEYVPKEKPQEVPKELEPEGHKCNVNAIPNCPLLADAISTMVGELRDAFITIKTDYETSLESCDRIEADFLAEIKTWDTLEKDSGVALAKAVTTIDTNTEEGAQKAREWTDLDKELTTKQDECQEKKIAILDTMCGIKVIRLELYRMGMKDDMFADCEVGDWVPAQCSVSCGVGGGTQALNREILVQPKGGCECPPLQMEQNCNNFECPIDCDMTDWSGWSKCSKDCDGGIRTRSRQTDIEPQFGGKVCDPDSETETCEEDACDVQCVLDDWSDWSDCSKMCSKGISVRRKGEITPALGNGPCNDPDSPERFEERPCNDIPCDDNVVCASKIDILMLLDGSGSVGYKGFEDLRAFYEQMTQRLGMGENGTKAGLITFSQNISVTQGLTLDRDELLGKMTEVPWPAKGETNTAEAMGTAMEVMSEGRADAQSVVFVLTDGMPNDVEATAMMAEKVKTKARLVFVAVGPNVDTDALSTWASFPPEMNVLSVDKFTDLRTKVGPFLADICPQLACDETVAGELGADYIGCQTQTVSGATCQVWTENFPNKPNKRNGRKAHRARMNLGTHNFCRNPDAEPSGIWCYTADPAIRWEHCEPRESTEYVPKAAIGLPAE